METGTFYVMNNGKNKSLHHRPHVVQKLHAITDTLVNGDVWKEITRLNIMEEEQDFSP